MSNSRIVELLAKKKSHELTLPEQQELLALLHSSEKDNLLSEQFDELFNTPLKFNKEEYESYMQDGLQLLHKKMLASQKEALVFSIKRKRFLAPVLAIAASVAVLIVAGIFLYQSINKNSQSQNQLHFSTAHTGSGSKTRVTLPDGTSVWLNANSKINYPDNFDKETREVTLEGEAYFDVVKDPAHPFLIHTKLMDIRVLGTAFNVKAYSGSKQFQTSVIRGLVEVTIRQNQNKNKKVRLKANEKITIPNENTAAPEVKSNVPASFIEITPVTKTETEEVVETLWMNNRIYFKSETLQSIALELEKYYNVKINIMNAGLKEKRFTGVFENESLEHILNTLKLAGGFTYKTTKENIIIIP